MPAEHGPWAERLLARKPVQPDQLSCGATCLVVAHALTDEAYAEALVTGGRPRFDSEVLGLHRRVTGARDVRGQLQLPWPRALGTPPWAFARHLGDARVRPVRLGDRASSYDALVTAVGHGPAGLYVGDAWLPRHVVLVLAGDPEALTVFDPARGARTRVPRSAFVEGRLGLSGWRVPWFTVTRGRRTPA